MSTPPIEFHDRVVVITGAARGLGLAHARALAARGASLVVNDLSDDAVAEAVATLQDEAQGPASRVVGVAGDVTDDAVNARLVSTAIERFGRLDVVVANAGFLRDRSFAKMTLAELDEVLAVHLRASASLAHAAWPRLVDGGYGRIVLTTSHAGLFGNFGQANYAAAKMGMVGLVNTLRIEGERHGIRVNALAPVAATDMSRGLFGPMEALLVPEHATAALVWLASEACTDSGTVLAAGGGRYAKVMVTQTAGLAIGSGAPPTPEEIAAHWERICDPTGARPFHDASAAIMALMMQAPRADDA